MTSEKTLRYVKMNEPMQRHAVLATKNRLNNVFHKESFMREIDRVIQHKSESTNLFDTLKEVDLRNILKGFDSFNTKRTCHFFLNRTAWIYQSEKGEHVYFSQKGNSVYYFDLFDLLGIFLGLPKKQTISYLEERWFGGKKSNWSHHHQERYLSNQNVINQIKHKDDEVQPLQRLLGKKVEIIEALNQYAFDKMVRKSWYWKGKPIFYISTGFLQENHCPDSSISTINQILNSLCVIGGLEKVPFDELPEEMANTAYKTAKDNKKNNHVSFYILHNFKEVLASMNEKAQTLLDNKIYYHRLTKTVVKELFGEAYHDRIYVQKTFGKPAKNEPVFVKGEETYYTEEERLETIFQEEIKEKGRCDRLVLERKSLLPRKRFLLMWQKIVEKYHCEIRIANKEDLVRFEKKKPFVYAQPKPLQFLPSVSMEKEPRSYRIKHRKHYIA